MKKRTLGAITMVLVGSVTFSVTNSLLAEHPINRTAQTDRQILSGDQQNADTIKLKEKNVKDQAKTTVNNINQEKEQIALTEKKDMEITVSTTAVNNREESNTPVQKNTTKVSTPVQKNTANVTATAVKPKVPVANTAANSTPTTTSQTTSRVAAAQTAPATPSPTTTTSATSTPTATNRGQQVSQTAKEKNTIRMDQKENNGNKK